MDPKLGTYLLCQLQIVHAKHPLSRDEMLNGPLFTRAAARFLCSYRIFAISYPV
jgi:hypothetical protein